MRSNILRLINNPLNPWQSHAVHWLDMPPPARLEIFEDRTQSILSKNDSPDLPFRWSLNPYRGCYHACAYCYARPSHEYLDFGAGTDFDRKLIIKKNAAVLLKKQFMKKSWRGDLIMFSGNTDCYQPLEASYHLTRACLQVCEEFKNPVAIITKSTLIERDLDLLTALSKKTSLTVSISIPFWDPHNARAIEPYVASPQRRIKTIKTLADAGIKVSVMISPIIPGLSDSDIPKILAAAKDAGARNASASMLRLAPAVAEVFEQRLRAALPLKADKVMNQIRDCRNDRLNQSGFEKRMRGDGPRWRAIEQLIDRQINRLGLNNNDDEISSDSFERPVAALRELTHSNGQLSLFPQ